MVRAPSLEPFSAQERVDQISEKKQRCYTGNQVIHSNLQALARASEDPATKEKQERDDHVEDIEHRPI
jgi:hypothetical protein